MTLWLFDSGSLVFSKSLETARRCARHYWSRQVRIETSFRIPLILLKAIINFTKEAYFSRRGGDPNDNPSVGRGIGLALGLLILQALSFFCTSHFMYRAGTTGVLLRGGLITAIYDRSLHLSTRARSSLTNGKLVNHISTDVSRIDFACQFFHFMWSAPIQMVLCLALLLANLGPSALAGYAFFVFLTPLLTRAMKLLFKLRKKSMVWTGVVIVLSLNDLELTIVQTSEQNSCKNYLVVLKLSSSSHGRFHS